MNVERVIARHRIGGWEFWPVTGELHRASEVRRLEPRAAKALQLLCEAGGDVVSQDELIAVVWQGRALSGNSVAVVIAQLRRALDDDAREPRLIETIPKCGYRLRADNGASQLAKNRSRAMLGVAVAALLILLAIAAFFQPLDRAGGEIAVTDVANQTGDASYTPVARATSELIVTDLGRYGFLVRRNGKGDLRLSSKLVIWDGLPYLGMTATDSSGVVRWSAMSKATPGAIPPVVQSRVGELAQRFPPKELRRRVADTGDRR
jgi:DNA-binding winged helix-turn-helix (wHTH) protein